MEQKICNEELYDEVSRELDIHKDIVKEVIHTQSIFTLNTIKRGLFESIRYVYLGKITIKLGKLKSMLRRVEENNKKKNGTITNDGTIPTQEGITT